MPSYSLSSVTSSSGSEKTAENGSTSVSEDDNSVTSSSSSRGRGVTTRRHSIGSNTHVRPERHRRRGWVEGSWEPSSAVEPDETEEVGPSPCDYCGETGHDNESCRPKKSPLSRTRSSSGKHRTHHLVETTSLTENVVDPISTEDEQVNVAVDKRPLFRSKTLSSMRFSGVALDVTTLGQVPASTREDLADQNDPSEWNRALACYATNHGILVSPPITKGHGSYDEISGLLRVNQREPRRKKQGHVVDSPQVPKALSDSMDLKDVEARSSDSSQQPSLPSKLPDLREPSLQGSSAIIRCRKCSAYGHTMKYCAIKEDERCIACKLMNGRHTPQCPIKTGRDARALSFVKRHYATVSSHNATSPAPCSPLQEALEDQLTETRSMELQETESLDSDRQMKRYSLPTHALEESVKVERREVLQVNKDSTRVKIPSKASVQKDEPKSNWTSSKEAAKATPSSQKDSTKPSSSSQRDSTKLATSVKKDSRKSSAPRDTPKASSNRDPGALPGGTRKESHQKEQQNPTVTSRKDGSQKELHTAVAGTRRESKTREIESKLIFPPNRGRHIRQETGSLEVRGAPISVPIVPQKMTLAGERQETDESLEGALMSSAVERVVTPEAGEPGPSEPGNNEDVGVTQDESTGQDDRAPWDEALRSQSDVAGPNALRPTKVVSFAVDTPRPHPGRRSSVQYPPESLTLPSYERNHRRSNSNPSEEVISLRMSSTASEKGNSHHSSAEVTSRSCGNHKGVNGMLQYDSFRPRSSAPVSDVSDIAQSASNSVTRLQDDNCSVGNVSLDENHPISRPEPRTTWLMGLTFRARKARVLHHPPPHNPKRQGKRGSPFPRILNSST
eukprot:CAMPEP_0184684922 /NCGR_PEP_ID=MMETSP0312-20130426/17127_1 /TAXON_ID=31354 /ORGANISM="Compsopogon coeruleus, Strain SAG 36.94" /LENGTH=846 /DNA_ID=CAMNT_0027138565 /DNA_START=203 /DNA_END=2743 /DNA_ORIENTATION=+